MLDVEQYLTEDVKYENSHKKESQQVKIRLEANKVIKSADGDEKSASNWLIALEDGDKQKVHCPIAPEEHNNMDEKSSCLMSKNGGWLNLKCLGCGKEASYFHNSNPIAKKSAEKKKITYIVPTFDKEAYRGQVENGLTNIEDIVGQIIKFLPPLEQKEEK